MIDRKTFMQLCHEAEQYLVAHHLSDAVYVLRSLLTTEHNVALKGRVDVIEENYHRMLHYMGKGVEDPARHDFHSAMLQNAVELLMDIKRHYRLTYEKDAYTKACNNIPIHWESDALDLHTLAEHLDPIEFQDALFDALWTAPRLNANTEQEIRQLLITISESACSEAISGITLALMEYFDSAKIRLLLDCCSAEGLPERSRAITGLALAIITYPRILGLFPNLEKSILETLSNPDLTKEVSLVMQQILKCRKAEMVESKIHEEFLPTLMKAQRERQRLGFEDNHIDLSNEDNGISNKTRKKLEKDLREMMELNSDGVDTSMGSFSMLKNFPFFQSPSHWLAPFQPERPEYYESKFLHQTGLCDSDKYSFSLALYNDTTGEAQKFLEIAEKGMEALNGIPLAKKSTNPSEEAYRNVITCLYRLLYRSNWSENWPKVFSEGGLGLDVKLLRDILKNDEEHLDTMSRLSFKYKIYSIAEKHLEAIVERDGANADTLRRLGFCYQNQGKCAQAIGQYQQADLLEPNQSWTLQQMAYCYSCLGHYEEQLQCLLELEKHDNENTETLTETGLCLMQLERWNEASQRFFKLEFLGKRVMPSLRAIAWCAFQQQNYPQAEKFYTRILTEAGSALKWEDYLNAGHTAWVQGDLPKALTLYRKYVNAYHATEPKATNLLLPFQKDIETLAKHGISSEDAALMQDLIPLQDSLEP